jgi:hypothetical protein
VNSATIILAVLILAPVVLLTFLKTNATLVFLSACLGDVLLQFVSPDAKQFLISFTAKVPQKYDSGENLIKILLLLLPVLITTLIMIRTVHSKSKLYINVLPALGTGLLLALLITPLLPSSLSNNILHTQLWTQIQSLKDLIVGLSSLSCLIVLCLQRPKTDHKKEKHA